MQHLLSVVFPQNIIVQPRTVLHRVACYLPESTAHNTQFATVNIQQMSEIFCWSKLYLIELSSVIHTSTKRIGTNLSLTSCDLAIWCEGHLKVLSKTTRVVIDHSHGIAEGLNKWVNLQYAIFQCPVWSLSVVIRLRVSSVFQHALLNDCKSLSQ